MRGITVFNHPARFKHHQAICGLQFTQAMTAQNETLVFFEQRRDNEVAVGLAIVLLIYRNRVSINVEELDLMRG